MTEQGMPIGRYPGITLRNAHLQYIVTWYVSPYGGDVDGVKVFIGDCDDGDVLFFVSEAEGHVCGTGVESTGFWSGYTKGIERVVIDGKARAEGWRDGRESMQGLRYTSNSKSAQHALMSPQLLERHPE